MYLPTELFFASFGSVLGTESKASPVVASTVTLSYTLSPLY